MREFLMYGVAVLAACGFGGAAATEPAQQSPAAGADSCVEVVVNGERTPSYSCLTQKLQPTEAITQRPSNQLGLFNQAATSNRMGNTFGTSVYPQRPPPVVPSSPLIPRP